jgi:hypothetical protein
VVSSSRDRSYYLLLTARPLLLLTRCEIARNSVGVECFDDAQPTVRGNREMRPSARSLAYSLYSLTVYLAYSGDLEYLLAD